MPKKYKIAVIFAASALVILVSGFAFSSWVLRHTPELNIHRMRGAESNIVFISPDGHSEAVFNENKEHVKESYNQASYNYCHPSKEPICHFIKDKLPWLFLGNTRGDPTNFSERFVAYRKDLALGLTFALKDIK